MAYYSIFPEKDTTIYSHPDRINMNTGKDEILELVEEKATTGEIYYSSRILIKFKNTDIRDIIQNKLTGVAKEVTTNTCEISLDLFAGENKRLTSDHTIIAFPLSQSFDEGTQRYEVNPPTTTTGSNQAANGATWVHRTNTTSSTWPTTNITFGMGASGSYSLQAGGGVWYTGSAFQGSQQFLKGDNLDTDINVTSIVQKHSASLFANSTYPTGIDNHGFLIKQPDLVEQDTSSSFGEMKYFSSDTHTIFPPKLCFKWDDSIHNSQSLAKQNGELSVSLYRNQEEYNQNDEAFFRIHVRDKYPTRQFTSSSNYLNPGYFTTSSFYSVRDAYTEEEVIPFDDNFTKMSADSEGMYFKLYMKGLQPERYYRILFKHKNDDGTTIYDNDYHFKVVR